MDTPADTFVALIFTIPFLNRTFTGRYGNSHKIKEDTVSTYNLAELFLMNIQGIDLIIIDDRTQSWILGHFCMRIFCK